MSQSNAQGIVITHPDYGILTGVSMGLAFWTKLDCGGQDCAAAFVDEQQARAFLATWPEGAAETVGEAGFAAVALNHRDDTHATMPNCVRAGLPAWMPDDRPCHFTFTARDDDDQCFAVGYSVEEALEQVCRQQSLIYPNRSFSQDDFVVADCRPVPDSYVERLKNQAHNQSMMAAISAPFTVADLVDAVDENDETVDAARPA